MPPGRYLIGIVSAAYLRDPNEPNSEKLYSKFPFQFQEFVVTLKPGDQVAPVFKKIDQTFNDQFGKRKFLGKWFPEYGKDYVENAGEYFDRLRNTVELNMRTFEENEIHAALEKVQHENPTRDVVMVSLPVAYGGARELNASQISLIVDWLKDVYCPIYQVGPPSSDLAKLDLIPNPNDPEWVGFSAEEKQAAFKLFEGVRKNRSRIEDLKAICRKLIQASPAPRAHEVQPPSSPTCEP